jgi:hypothetical protein
MATPSTRAPATSVESFGELVHRHAVRASAAPLTGETTPVDEELRYLYAPPDSEVASPVRTWPQRLPLDALSWPDFERLCLRLVRTLGGVEHAQLYGVPGQAQSGIDIYARRAGGAYTVYQCRRVATFTAAGIFDVVTDFLEGAWRGRATELVLCTSADLSRTELAEAVEAAHERLCSIGKSFLPWDVGRLSEELKAQPRLILEFFGRSWVKAFVPGAVEELTHRLDAQQLRQLRGALRELYESFGSVGRSRAEVREPCSAASCCHGTSYRLSPRAHAAGPSPAPPRRRPAPTSPDRAAGIGARPSCQRRSATRQLPLSDHRVA